MLAAVPPAAKDTPVPNDTGIVDEMVALVIDSPATAPATRFN